MRHEHAPRTLEQSKRHYRFLFFIGGTILTAAAFAPAIATSSAGDLVSAIVIPSLIVASVEFGAIYGEYAYSSSSQPQALERQPVNQTDVIDRQAA